MFWHSWYERRGQLASNNRSRTTCTSRKPDGPLEDNIKSLRGDYMKTCDGRNKKQKLKMINVAEYILSHGLFVTTQEIGNLISGKPKANVFRQGQVAFKCHSDLRKRYWLSS